MNCNLKWETDWDYITEDSPSSWLLLDTEKEINNSDNNDS